ncbi:glycoside hydrolase family 2 protein [Lachnospiraceae bacterium ZAX-1]
MKKQTLNGQWELSYDDVTCKGEVPGSVYSFLLDAGKMEDPFYRENELDALALMDHKFVFHRNFSPIKGWKAGDRILLSCQGLDTICEVNVNGKAVGYANNMHRLWEFDLTDVVKDGENEVELRFASPVQYIKEKLEKEFIGGMTDAMQGFPLIRKAHCMYGWDWGPRLPDAGIWRDISLVYVDSARIEDVHIRQKHENGAVSVKTCVTQSGSDVLAQVALKITMPSGDTIEAKNGQWIEIEEPKLWWPNGYGEQPLYTVLVQLIEEGTVVDTTTKRIGLRTMTVVREKDEWGESFDQCCNGVRFFAMGGDYIPEDNILARVTKERTRVLLQQCVDANFNSVRVWGGGYYPNDWFYDICDELGLVVWQDFMFACANYRLTNEFEENIQEEVIQTVRRLRSHPCIGLWCGNNEMEMFQEQEAYFGTAKTRSDYIRMFEHIIPKIVQVEDPDSFYWPASPSSGGGFFEPNDPNRGDVHYWDVWHAMKPFTDYRNYFFRYASEFGFQSFPSRPTIETFTLPEDRNIFSRVMERHQRNGSANGRIMHYLSQTYLYPTTFDTVIYASQLLQAEAIRYGVEHWRRNRGRCMGAVYWQLNDCWPVASWASIDYFGRWKALHYYAKRFFAPVMVSCEEIGESEGRPSINEEWIAPLECSGRISVANETRAEVFGTLYWQLRGNEAKILRQGKEDLKVPALTSIWIEKLNFTGTDPLSTYLSYSFEVKGQVVSYGTVLFTAPKHFHWLNPNLSYHIEGDTVTIKAASFAKSVEISSLEEPDLILSDNYFDMSDGEYKVKIKAGAPKTLKLVSVYDIGRQ